MTPSLNLGEAFFISSFHLEPSLREVCMSTAFFCGAKFPSSSLTEGVYLWRILFSVDFSHLVFYSSKNIR